MKKAFSYIRKLFSAFIIAAMLLSAFALAYDNSGIKEVNPSGATSTKWEGVQFVSNLTEGFAWFLTDENGFNNPQTMDQIDILVMGDSYIEAQQVPQRQNVTSKLQEMSGNSCYGIGVAGTYMVYCIHNINNAISTYHPSKAIIMDVHNGSIRPSEKDVDLVLSHELENGGVSFDSGLMYYIKHIPCVKPLLYGIRNWITAGSDAEPDSAAGDVSPEYLSKLKQLLSLYADAAARADVIPILVYFPTEKLSSDGSVDYITDPGIEFYAEACGELGIEFVDMTDSFRQLYAEEHKLAHGFINTSVDSGHLNKYGHSVTAERLAELIRGLEVG